MEREENAVNRKAAEVSEGRTVGLKHELQMAVEERSVLRRKVI